MRELSFNHGRLTFSNETYEMLPCLPDSVERRVQLFHMADWGLTETGFSNFDDLNRLKTETNFAWLHISGSAGDEFFSLLRSSLELSDELIKCLRSPHRRSFFQDFSDGLFWSLQRPAVSENVDAIESINFFLGDKYLITRQFSHDNAFTIVSHKLMGLGEQIKDYGADSLASELLEDVLNSYLEVLKFGGTRLEVIQNKIIRNPGKDELVMINRSQQIIWILLNAVWPVESILQAITRSRSPVITPEGRRHLDSCLLEANSVLRMFETYRAMSYNLMDVYVSGLSLRTNETTTVLTMIATLFLPPTLIAGIYGMNFNIPEVHFPGGYYISLGIMFLISGGLLVWLKLRGFVRF